MKLHGNYLKEGRCNISFKTERQILYNETSNILFGIALQNNILFLKKLVNGFVVTMVNYTEKIPVLMSLIFSGRDNRCKLISNSNRVYEEK